MGEAEMGSPGATSGGSGQLGYDPAAMAKGLAAIDGATSEVRTLLGTIQQEVDVLRGSWRAQSNVAFTRVHLRWADRAQVINNALRIMQEKLSAADVTYRRTEQAQVDQYQAIANSI
jgi:WXG100 family type VII secretion target